MSTQEKTPTVLVTGANRGIGLALCVELRSRGWEVIATSRAPSQELDALGFRWERLDVTSESSISALATTLKDVVLDLLLHNAGVSCKDNIDALDFQGMRRQYEVNTLGPLRVTGALLSTLKRGSKVAIVSSRMGSMADNATGRQYGYRVSKAAVNMVGVNLAQDLAPRGIAVGILHPGYVRTQMTEGRGEVEPDHAAKGLVARIEELTLATTGQFRHADGRTLPW
ncbi:MAG: SDR family oxidoreductase [Myxococcota bacterium]|nr:SDR family oxidoreductase [Myxococcota bacterium]